MKLKNGGPFHPCGDQSTTQPHDGAYLRDWLAGKAMPAVIADAEQFNDKMMREHSSARISKQEVAKNCFEYADAMIAERKKEAE